MLLETNDLARLLVTRISPCGNTAGRFVARIIADVESARVRTNFDDLELGTRKDTTLAQGETNRSTRRALVAGGLVAGTAVSVHMVTAVTRIAVVALLFGAGLAVVSCSSTATPNSRHSHTHQASEPRSVPTVAGVALLPVIRPVRQACNRLAKTKSVLVLCPTILSRPATTHPATPIGVYTFHACHALERPAGCPLYDLAIMYGVPDEPPNGDGGHNPPATFLHFETLGGRYVAEALSLHGLSGTVPLQRLIGRRTIAGHHGLLYFGLPYQHGGGEYGSHFTFIWPQGLWRYAASLHSWKPHAATLRVLRALIASLAPVNPSVN